MQRRVALTWDEVCVYASVVVGRAGKRGEKGPKRRRKWSEKYDVEAAERALPLLQRTGQHARLPPQSNGMRRTVGVLLIAPPSLPAAA